MQYFNRFLRNNRILSNYKVGTILSIPKDSFVDSFRAYRGIEQKNVGSGSVLDDYQDRWCKEYVKVRNDLKIQKWEF